MNRREALSAVSFLLGGSVIGAEAFLSGCSSPKADMGLLSAEDISLLDEVGETILPATASSPGAKETMIGQFMKTIVSDCYKEDEQKIFKDGIVKLQEKSNQTYGKEFLRISAEERHDLLVALDAEAKNYNNTRKPEDPSHHYYTMMKQLTLWGYFTSEAGMTKALRHVAVPGRYESCVPLKPGEKAWA